MQLPMMRINEENYVPSAGQIGRNLNQSTVVLGKRPAVFYRNSPISGTERKTIAFPQVERSLVTSVLDRS